MSSSDTRVITAHIPTELAERVDVLADRLERSRGWIVKQALADYVITEERRFQLTLEALADVDQGRLAEHVAVEAWIERLLEGEPAQPPEC